MIGGGSVAALATHVGNHLIDVDPSVAAVGQQGAMAAEAFFDFGEIQGSAVFGAPAES